MLIAFVHLRWMGTPPYVHHFNKGDNFVRIENSVCFCGRQFYPHGAILKRTNMLTVFPSVREKAGKFYLFSRSGKSQGILKLVREVFEFRPKVIEKSGKFWF